MSCASTTASSACSASSWSGLPPNANCSSTATPTASATSPACGYPARWCATWRLRCSGGAAGPRRAPAWPRCERPRFRDGWSHRSAGAVVPAPGDRREQLPGIGLLRVPVDLVGVGDLDDLALVHDHDFVGDVF